jgi:hypothetical protein
MTMKNVYVVLFEGEAKVYDTLEGAQRCMSILGSSSKLITAIMYEDV